MGRFAASSRRARMAYREFVGAGIPQGRRPELQGGGLIRSLGGWAAVQALRRGREQYIADERVPGSSAFVEALQMEIAAQSPASHPAPALEAIIQRVCATLGISPTALQAGSRRSIACRAREGIAYLALEVEGYPGPRLVSLLGVRPPSIHKAAQRGRQAQDEWDRILKSAKK